MKPSETFLWGMIFGSAIAVAMCAAFAVHGQPEPDTVVTRWVKVGERHNCKTEPVWSPDRPGPTYAANCYDDDETVQHTLVNWIYQRRMALAIREGMVR